MCGISLLGTIILVKRITMPLEDSSDDDLLTLLTSSDEEIILNRRKTHEKIRGYVNNVALFQFFPRFALTLTV
jgi:hypothetical protein